MEHHRLLNPKKRMLREWTMPGTAAMEQVHIFFLFAQQIYPSTVDSPKKQCRFGLLAFLLLSMLGIYHGSIETCKLIKRIWFFRSRTMASLEQRMPRCSYPPKNRLLMTFLRVDQAKAMYVASLKTRFLYSCVCIVPYSNQLTFFILNVLTEGVQLRRRHGRRRAFRACPCSGEDRDRPPSPSGRSGAQHGSRWIQQPYQQQPQVSFFCWNCGEKKGNTLISKSPKP